MIQGGLAWTGVPAQSKRITKVEDLGPHMENPSALIYILA
jgi:hypothetical protein